MKWATHDMFQNKATVLKMRWNIIIYQLYISMIVYVQDMT